MIDRNPRLIKRGDVIRVQVPGGEPYEEVVRDVDVVLHLANGADHIVNGAGSVELLDDNELTTELQEQIEAMLESEG